MCLCEVLDHIKTNNSQIESWVFKNYLFDLHDSGQLTIKYIQYKESKHKTQALVIKKVPLIRC